MHHTWVTEDTKCIIPGLLRRLVGINKTLDLCRLLVLRRAFRNYYTVLLNNHFQICVKMKHCNQKTETALQFIEMFLLFVALYNSCLKSHAF